MLAGIVKTKMAMRFAAISAIMAARCALTLPVAIKINNVATGTAAAIVDSTMLLRGL